MKEKVFIEAVSGLGLSAVRFFGETGSTNQEALNWLKEGVADASLVFADTQTAGRGRFQRKWITTPGAALALSLILKPVKKQLDHLALFSPMAALALCSVLEKEYSLQPLIKWPNDVLLQRKKTCGILVEAAWQNGELQGLVIGIGVNVAPEAVPTADDLLFPATCIQAHLEKKVSRADLLHNLVSELLEWQQKIGSAYFMDEFRKRLAFKNEWVKVQQPDGQDLHGKVIDVSQDGDLVLETQNVKKIKITAGDVHLRPRNF